MLITAAVAKEEIVALIDALTPLRIAIDAKRGRTITLGRPRLELVPDVGIRLRGDARITWDVAGMTIPVTLQNWQVLLQPHVVTHGRSRVLAFEPIIEELDLKLVPTLVSDKIVRAIGDAVAQNRDKLAWSFAQMLARRFPIPAKLGGGALTLVATDGAVGVTSEDVKFTLLFQADVEREAPRSRRAPKSVRRPLSERRPQIG